MKAASRPQVQVVSHGPHPANSLVRIRVASRKPTVIAELVD